MATYDVAIIRQSDGEMRVVFPRELSRTMLARGYNRVAIEITDTGLLLKPYVDYGARKQGRSAELPDWGTDAVQE